MLFVSFLLSQLILASASSLLSLTQPRNAYALTELGGIEARQTTTSSGTVPAACQADCDPINAVVNQGCPPDDCCKSSFVTAYFNCLKCVGGALNITDYTPAQSVLDDLTVQCDVRGLQVPKLTLPGINPNRPLPSTPAAGFPSTVTATGSAPLNQPPPALTSAISQLTMTTAASTPTTAPRASNTPSSAKSDRFLTPHFSHFSASAIMVGGFIYLAL